LLLLIVGLEEARATGRDDAKFLDKSVDAWVRQLKHSDPGMRRSAAFALGKLGMQTHAAMSGVIGPLGGTLAIQKVGQPWPVVEALAGALQDREPEVRQAVAFALGDMGPSIYTGPPGWLADLLSNDTNADVRRSAAYALGKNGYRANRYRQVLQNALADPAPEVRQNAAWALGHLGGHGGQEVVNALKRTASGDADALVRRDALRALGQIGRPLAESAVKILRDRLKNDTKASVRNAALAALCNTVGPTDQDVVADLLPLLSSTDADVARDAALALGNIGGKEARPAVPILHALLKEQELLLQRLASASLANIGPDAEPARADLTAFLADRSQDWLVRRNAALALANMHGKARPSLNVLIDTLRPGEHEDVQMFAIEAIHHIGAAYIENEDAIRDDLKPALPALIHILKQKDGPRFVRQRAVWALYLTSLDGTEAGAALTAVLNDTDPYTRIIRYEAAVRLGLQLGPRVPDKALDVLLAYLTDKEMVRYEGSGTSTDTAGGKLKAGQSQVRESGGGDPRRAPCWALKEIGRKANRPDIMRALKETAQAQDEGVRKAAEEALQAITGPP
jgi:HEAT repeat protein